MKNTHHCETCRCEKWVPKDGDIYYYVSGHGKIGSVPWYEEDFDLGCFQFDNVFRTEEAAQKALEAITKVLREAEKG